MKQIRILFYYEWLHFSAEKSLLLFTLLMLACGFYGIFSGTAAIDTQRQKIENLNGLYSENIAEMKTKYPGSADAGDIGYYHSAFSKNNPGSWAALAIGQRDVNAPYLKIRLLAVQAQLYNSENTNPNKLAAGSFDLSFVFVFLLPLFIIAISFNILSAEKEKGTLRLLLAQPLPLSRILLAKLLFRFTLILGLILILSLIGIVWSHAEPDLRVLLWLLSVILYSIFWLGIVCCIAVLHKSSSFNAITLLGIWLLLTIIFPVLINVFAEVKKPVAEGLQLSLKQRDEVHAGWDRPKAETMKRFFIRYPQFSQTTSVEGKFKWKWYFAFQELGDQSVEQLYQDYMRKMVERQDFSTSLSIGSAPAVLQQILTAMAGTDLKQQLAFVDSTKAYHDRLKDFYYPFLYGDKPFTHADFDQEPQHSFTAKPDWQRINSGLLVLLISNIIVLSAALIIYQSAKKKIY